MFKKELPLPRPIILGPKNAVRTFGSGFLLNHSTLGGAPDSGTKEATFMGSIFSWEIFGVKKTNVGPRKMGNPGLEAL